MTKDDNTEFIAVLQSFDLTVQKIALEARSLIFDVLPQTVEVVWSQQKTMGYGTGPKKMTEHFCWIAPYKKHVLLGFNYGSELVDPEHLLEGTGRLFRHIRLTRQEDARKPAVRALLKQATTHRVPPPPKNA